MSYMPIYDNILSCLNVDCANEPLGISQFPRMFTDAHILNIYHDKT